MLTSIVSPPLLTHVNASELSQSLPQVTVISFRGPQDTGGVSKGLKPLIKQLNSKVNWLAPALAESVKADASQKRTDDFAVRYGQFPLPVIEGHESFCRDYLWPLFHGMPELAVFEASDWKAYKQLNKAMGNDAIALSKGSFPTIAWIHDYHFAFLAPSIASEAGMVPCQFWHVSWPAPDKLIGSPIIADLILALLSNKLLGFHTTEYALNFLNSVQEFLPSAQVDLMKMEVRINGQTTSVVVMPLGLDFAHWQHMANASRPKAAVIPKKYSLASQVILGIDRLDYAKGVFEKLYGIEAFLQTQPHWHRRFHFVQIAQSVQNESKANREYAEMVKAKVDQVNNSFRADDWEPILLLDESLGHEELAAWYMAADVLLVTPVRDGLNLIAKEYVACRIDEQGVLIVSKQAGSSAELASGALVVDAHDANQIGRSIAHALTMNVEEKRRRMLSMRHVVGWNQLHDWAMAFLKQAVSCK
jgi:trehalose 6-phosphate synthase